MELPARLGGRLARIAAVLGVLCLTACGGSGDHAGAPSVEQPAVMATFAGIPVLPEADDTNTAGDELEGSVGGWRVVSAFTLALGGAEADSWGGGAVPHIGEGTMELSASGGAPSWALYRFDELVAEDQPQQLRFELAGDPPAQFWVGLADYGAAAWRWVQVAKVAAGLPLELAELELTISAGGHWYVVLVVHGGAELTLAQLTLDVDGPWPSAPTHVVAQKGAPGEVELSWAKAELAEGYAIYRDSKDTPFAEVGDVEQWTDKDAGDEARTYWLKSLSVRGSSGFSYPAYADPGPLQVHLVDPDGCHSTSMATVDGKPMIVYHRVWHGPHGYDAYFPAVAYATTEQPESAADWEVMDWIGDGEYPDWDYVVGVTDILSLTVIGGLPAFTAEGSYFRCTTTTPSSPADWAVHRIDEEAGYPTFAPLIETEGKPALAYFDINSEMLKFARATTAAPASAVDWVSCELDVQGNQVDRRHLALRVFSGRPAVCYQQKGEIWHPGSLMFAHATTAAPSDVSHWDIHVIDEAMGWTGNSPWLAELDGAPAVSYIYPAASESMDLEFARATTAEPTAQSDWEVHTVNPGGQWAGHSTFLAVVDGKPTICFFDDPQVKVAAATTATPAGSEDWEVEAMPRVGDAFRARALLVLGGNPAVSAASDGLYFARRE